MPYLVERVVTAGARARPIPLAALLLFLPSTLGLATVGSAAEPPTVPVGVAPGGLRVPQLAGACSSFHWAASHEALRFELVVYEVDEAPTQDTSHEDGWVTAEEISLLDLHGTGLVVLSACETGLGDIRIGEGVSGLRRAFLFAGAETLVTSLYKVPDSATQALMREFYSRLAKGETKLAALTRWTM